MKAKAVNHSICEECWNDRNPGRTPHRVVDGSGQSKQETCCFCGKSHNSGIHVRESSLLTACQVAHGELLRR